MGETRQLRSGAGVPDRAGRTIAEGIVPSDTAQIAEAVADEMRGFRANQGQSDARARYLCENGTPVHRDDQPAGAGCHGGPGNLTLWAVAQAVECDPDDVLDLLRIAGWDLADPSHHVKDVGKIDVAPYNASLLGVFEERLAGGEQRGAAGLEQRGVRVEVVGQLGGERPLGGEVADQALEPAVERLPRIDLVELSCSAERDSSSTSWT